MPEPVAEQPPRMEIPYRNTAQQQGYQRNASPKRVNDLQKALRENEVDLPTAVLLNLRGVSVDDVTEDAGGHRYLVVERRDWPSPFYIVDGQHRLRALERLAAEEGAYERWRHYPIPFVCVVGANELQEMEQFYVVNSTAKSVKTDLALDLLRELQSQIGLDRSGLGSPQAAGSLRLRHGKASAKPGRQNARGRSGVRLGLLALTRKNPLGPAILRRPSQSTVFGTVLGGMHLDCVGRIPVMWRDRSLYLLGVPPARTGQRLSCPAAGDAPGRDRYGSTAQSSMAITSIRPRPAMRPRTATASPVRKATACSGSRSWQCTWPKSHSSPS